MTKMTDEQLKEALTAGKKTADIAAEYGLTVRAVRSRKAKLAAKGFSPEHDMTHQVPDGFLMKGQSTLYGKDGEIKLTWVKSAIDRERQLDLLREFIEGMKEDLPREIPVAKPAVGTMDVLLNQ